MFKWVYRKAIQDLLEVVREMLEKVLTSGSTSSRGQTDNHFPSTDDIEKQMEVMRDAKKEKEKDEKEEAHRVLSGRR